MLNGVFGSPEAASLKNQAPKIGAGGLTPQYIKRRLEGRPPKNPDRALRFSEKKISGPLKIRTGHFVFPKKKNFEAKKAGCNKKVLKCAPAVMMSPRKPAPLGCRPGGRGECPRARDGCHTREASTALRLPAAQPARLCSPLQLLYLQ